MQLLLLLTAYAYDIHKWTRVKAACYRKKVTTKSNTQIAADKMDTEGYNFKSNQFIVRTPIQRCMSK